MSLRLAPLGEGPAIPLSRLITLIGRDVDCDARIDSRRISRRHCLVVQFENHAVIRDLGSTNGIYSGVKRVDEVDIKPGEEVIIANLKYRLELNTGEGSLGASKPTDDALAGDEPPVAQKPPTVITDENKVP